MFTPPNFISLVRHDFPNGTTIVATAVLEHKATFLLFNGMPDTPDGFGNATVSTSIASNLFATYLSGTATDATGNTSEFGPDVLVTALAPAVTGNAVNATEQGLFTEIVASFVDPSSSSASSYTALVAWGDGASSQGVVQASGNGFNVIASHTYAEEGGPDTVMTTITDAPGVSGSGSSMASVVDATLTATAKTVNFSEAASSTQVVASFQDANPSAFAGQFTAFISWGDGTPGSPGTISANGTGFDVSGTHVYATKGTYPITVKILDASSFAPANIGCARQARLLGCRIVRHPYQRGLLEIARALTHPDGQRNEPGATSKMPPRSGDVFLDILRAADRSWTTNLMDALFDPGRFRVLAVSRARCD